MIKKQNKKILRILILAIILIYPMTFFAKRSVIFKEKLDVCKRRYYRFRSEDYLFWHYFYVVDFSVKKKKIFVTIKSLARPDYLNSIKNPYEFKSFMKFFLDQANEKKIKRKLDITQLVKKINELYGTKISKSDFFGLVQYFMSRTTSRFFYIESILDKNDKFVGFKFSAKNGETIFFANCLMPLVYINGDGKIFSFAGAEKGRVIGSVICETPITKKEMKKIIEKGCNQSKKERVK